MTANALACKLARFNVKCTKRATASSVYAGFAVFTKCIFFYSLGPPVQLVCGQTCSKTGQGKYRWTASWCHVTGLQVKWLPSVCIFCVLLAPHPGLWSGGSLCHRFVFGCQQAEQTGPNGAGAGEGFCKSQSRSSAV